MFTLRITKGKERIDDPLGVHLYGSGGADFFYHKNHQGSITAITDISGNISKMYKYDAFGRKYLETGPPLVDEFAYTARERHDRTGLSHYRNRFYYAQIGRFISQDPIGVLGGTNLYAYVGNNPVNYIDPLGLYSFDAFWDDWSAAADIRSSAAFWEAYSESAFGDSNVLRATAKATLGDIMGSLLGASGMLDIQEDAEILGDRCTSTKDKMLAAGDIALIGLSYYGIGTTQVTGRVAGQTRTSRVIGLRNRYGQHFYTDKYGFYFAIDKSRHYLHIGPFRPF